MNKKVSIFVVLLLLFNLLSPYAAFAENVEIEEDTYELDDVNACLVDLLDREELGEEDAKDFHPDQLNLDEEEQVIFEDCLALLSLNEQETAVEEEVEEPTVEEGTEETVTEETEEPAVEEGTEETVTEETEEPAVEEGTEETVSEETEEPTVEEGTEETVTEEAAEEPVVEEGTEESKVEEEAVTEEEQEESSMVMFSMRTTSTPVTKATSRLGHLYGSTKIYRNLGDTNTLNTSNLTHAVYYIKQEAQYDGSTYYLLSTQPSATNGVVGWAKASELTTHAHTVADKQSKTFQVKGTGNAYTKAWGGNKDLAFNLSKEKGKTFQVHLTEKVGDNTWYRGTLNNRTVWIQSSNVETAEKATSRLGHIYGSTQIYRNLGDSNTVSTSNLTHAVYYIKRETQYNGQTYYLLSTQPSATNGVIGWARASQVTSHTHTVVDKQSKTFHVKGTGNAYSKAWGGSKDLVFNLSKEKGKTFQVHLTEKVGDTTWYRGTLNNRTVWIQSSNVETAGKATSRLGHIYGSTQIYPTLGDSKTVSTSNLTHAVYYIKRETQYNGQTYYLLSTQPSATDGVIGWARASQLTTHAHTVVDKQNKTFQVKGTGNAYTKAWGGNKDVVFNLSREKGKTFQVHLTEKVGNSTWYRGTLNSRTVWINSTDVETVGKATSRLGHIYGSTQIYRNLGDSNTVSTSNLTHAVYYIKRETQFNGQTYYLLSTQPSATNGVIGWARASQLTTHTHNVVDTQSKSFIISGSGSAYTKAWGGNKDLVYNLSNERGKTFNVHLTEKVGNNTWYRGTLNNRTVWIHSSYLTHSLNTRTNYNITLDRAATLQQGANAQTDRYTQYVHRDYVRKSGNDYYVNASSLNVRSGPGTNYAVVDQLKNGQRLSIRRTTGNWYQLFWVDANKKDIIYYLDPNNFINDQVQQFQFLDLAKTSGATNTALNNFLRGKGTLSGQGQAFIDAGRTHGINDVYLLSHALLETGNGTSTLAKGVKVNGVTVYNMYGIGAKDHCPIECGSQYAYDKGWTTPYKSIVGGAAFIGNSYVKSGQNTLYKMRWNPEGMVRNGRPTHQYATDIGWASKQVHTMYNLYQGIGSYNLNLDIPVYQ